MGVVTIAQQETVARNRLQLSDLLRDGYVFGLQQMFPFVSGLGG